MFPIRCIIFDPFGPLYCPRTPCIYSGFFLFQIPMYFRISSLLTSYIFSPPDSGRVNCRPLPSKCETTCSFYNTRSTIAIPSFSSCSRIGSHISLVYGTSTPGVEIVPSRTNCVAIPQGMPTVRAIAECPFGAPYASSVDVMISCPHFSARQAFLLLERYAPQYRQIVRPRTCAAT
jgi:hypothetical protein